MRSSRSPSYLPACMANNEEEEEGWSRITSPDKLKWQVNHGYLLVLNQPMQKTRAVVGKHYERPAGWQSSVRDNKADEKSEDKKSEDKPADADDKKDDKDAEEKK